MYDILIKGASIVNPWEKTSKKGDLAITQGKIAKIAPKISSSAQDIVDAEGLYLTPALIDAHTHCYHTAGIPGAWAGDYGIDPDAFSFRSGCTTMIDTGSAGFQNFSHFHATVIERCQSRVYALLNIADWGMTTLWTEQFPDLFNIDKCIETAKKYKEIIGIKIAHYWYGDWKHLDLGLRAGSEAGLPLMVDYGRFKKERPTHEMTARLRKGDILTHCYRAPVPVINPQGKVFSYLREARERGVLFDLGHGQGSFLFRNAVPAVQQGFFPDFVSTDIHALSMNDACQDMATVLSKMLVMGMPFEDIIYAATAAPAQAFGLDLCRLEEGAPADVALFTIQEGAFGYKDIGGGVLRGRQRIACEMTFKEGKLMWDRNARMGVPYETLPPLYGIDPAIEEYTPPSED